MKEGRGWKFLLLLDEAMLMLLNYDSAYVFELTSIQFYLDYLPVLDTSLKFLSDLVLDILADSSFMYYLPRTGVLFSLSMLLGLQYFSL